MDTVTRFDPVAEHEKTRAALRAVVPRLARLWGDVPDREAASGIPVWSVGDVCAHLAAVYLAFSSVVSPDEEALDWNSVLPPGDGALIDRITAVNATSIGLFGGEERARLGDLVAERGETFLRVTEGLAPDIPVTVPWYGRELTLSTVTGLLLSESLVHGLDIARGAGLPWRIDPDEARLAIGQSMPTMMRLTVDTEKARGVRLAFDLAITGGPRLAVVVDDGTATVTRDAPPRAYDCRITVGPDTFLLVAFRRVPIWKAVASGRMRAGGRRPWLAPRLGRLIGTP